MEMRDLRPYPSIKEQNKALLQLESERGKGWGRGMSRVEFQHIFVTRIAKNREGK